jgi:hypothetical protein
MRVAETDPLAASADVADKVAKQLMREIGRSERGSSAP